MADHLVPIRVKITRGVARNGQVQNIYPDFNKIAPELRGGMDWTYFFDTHGIGWHYDHKSGFGEVDDYNNDPNCQFGATMVPEAFAMAAVANFPDRVQTITEAEFEKFYEERAHAHEPDELEDVEVLQGLLLRHQLEQAGLMATPSQEEKQRRALALDPQHPSRGIRRNTNKRYEAIKAKRGFTVAPSVRKRPL